MKIDMIRALRIGSEQSELDLLASSCRISVIMNSILGIDEDEQMIVLED